MQRLLLLLVLLPTRLLAADDLTVLSEQELGYPPREMLHRYLLKECQKHFDARRQTVAALKTPADVKRRQDELKQKFIASLGGFPERTPLNPRVVGTLQRDGYRIDKVIYESRPNHHVTANLYVPDHLNGRAAGVLVPCGHSANGKAAEAYQRACILLAKNGFVVLCYDPIGQGERIQLLDKLGKPAIAGSTSEHTMCGIGALLVGWQTASYRIWDGIRSMDYLASRPEVDPERLGCTGNSGGGTLTAYLMALDDRILAAAPSCYITSLERLFATIGPQDAEQNITGQVAFGMEHADYITLRAPKPTLICTGTQDFFDIQGAWTTFREAKLLYGLLGHGERVDLFEYNDKHGFSKPRREAACRWMCRWLQGRDVAVVEGEFPIAKDEELQCTRTGQVIEDLKGKSVFDLNLERENELRKHRADRTPEQIRGDARRLLAIGMESPAPMTPLGRTRVLQRDGHSISQSVVTRGDGVQLPTLLYKPTRAASAAPVIYLAGDGMAADAAPIASLVEKGRTVLAVDLRGMGETSPAQNPSRRSSFGADAREAFLSLHLGRPLLGQRVQDILDVSFPAEQLELVSSELVGVGAAGPAALHIAALKPAIRGLTLDRCLVSWSSVVRTPVSVNQLANVVPGTLEHYDLPDLAATLAPRPLTIKNPVDAANKPVSQEELERVYARVREAYAKAGAADQLILIGAR